MSKTDKIWNPYKVGEILIFQSNAGERDTIFVNNIEIEKVDSDPLAVTPDKLEVLSVIANHSTPHSKYNFEKMEDSFFELPATKSKSTLINFKLMAKGSWFYGESYYLNEIEKLKETTLIVDGQTYNDVILIEPQEKIIKEYSQERDEFITKMYWSKSKGYIRFDLKNNVIWELL